HVFFMWETISSRIKWGTLDTVNITFCVPGAARMTSQFPDENRWTVIEQAFLALLQQFEQAEQTRQQAETQREKAEAQRVFNEEMREGAELMRQHEEKIRHSSEKLRLEWEAARKKNEALREEANKARLKSALTRHLLAERFVRIRKRLPYDLNPQVNGD